MCVCVDKMVDLLFVHWGDSRRHLLSTLSLRNSKTMAAAEITAGNSIMS